MAIREELVASAAQFLQDPSVASSSLENKISFLRAKNLTQEEIDSSLARAGGPTTSAAHPPSTAPYPSAPLQPYHQPYPPYAWQQAPPPRAPARDWRDWFIMATVVSGVGYGLYALGKRYITPLVAPPTPERLEQDKRAIEEQFDRAFALVEQLAQDTEELKKAEQERTKRLDSALTDLERTMADLKTANRRREDDAQRIRDDVQALKDAIPKAMSSQKDLTDGRLSEINGELGSLKALVTQRMSPAAGSLQSQRAVTAGGDEADDSSDAQAAVAGKSTTQNGGGRRAGVNSSGKASIPAWQLAAAATMTTSRSKNGDVGNSGEAE
ncbi:peroxisomal membrane anchor protein (Pex14) [Ophiocordyceps camponoti-floridani]|uniref:Peroxisomal membrane protein PEX14 n=1 Tax=Ophiocordyceps camponoti-floridani TaxID=2030778 RepID=A0A8H4QDZ0_9HYPO|nr:peroxisomal membrane anchor protein (Pex14) [Ophiocordyceps camponoti-floridani]